ncbi:MAG: fructose-6-phosphate aldolase [Armatimonadota bacterium]|nr:fructose-6-phosphate aldolase [Armatimonadota bacterium]MDR7485013.1 fructose-6-phosphate aldolase [Armatimonadota bacterium]MDR7533686.1 fructose-6-phosphate aldolase [Armatimonadota bacterium]MDR7535527.1 fructose-6-phosphate aldolase [Armatimonadota bacterium]
MLFFVDTANLEEIRTAHGWGILDGVTTNPTLVAKEGRPHRAQIEEICRITSGPVSVETTVADADGMVREGEEFATWAPNVVVKVPVTPAGLLALRALRARGIPVNVTLVFSVNQALLAAKAGATYVSPFVGRLDDIGHDGMQVVRDIVTVFRTYRFETRVLAASLRHPVHVVEAARAGADVATMPFKVMEQLFKHTLTDVGLERFLADARRLQAELEARRTRV